ncbi:MAG: head-tail connector protein [Planctomycetaceae bacterium]|nr:head-tail connector protein [Planctomycetaceae bacterium]
MGVRVIQQPTEESLSLAEAKAHLRVDVDDEDALIGSLITAARLTVERQCWRQVAQATLRFTLDAFPACSVIYLPRPPLVSVESIQYEDLAGETRTLDAGDYFVDDTSEPGRISLKSGYAWPETNLQPGCVVIDYVAGLDPEDVPADLKAAMLLIVGHLYAHREGVVAGQAVNELPLGVSALLSLHRFRDHRVTEQMRQ